MYHLDHVGRHVPSTLDVSRAAARRHARAAALRERDAARPRARSRHRPHRWLHLVAVRRP